MSVKPPFILYVRKTSVYLSIKPPFIRIECFHSAEAPLLGPVTAFYQEDSLVWLLVK